MSNTDHDQADGDLRAGEYVLGLFDPAEARAFEAEIAHNKDLAASVAFWAERLHPLLAHVNAVSPPVELWERIVSDTCGAPKPALIRQSPIGSAPDQRRTSIWHSLPAWRTATAGFAVAASLACFALLHHAAAPRIVAALLPKGQTGPVIVAQVLPGDQLSLRPIGRIVPVDGRDLEIWSLPDGANIPAPVGILSQRGTVIAKAHFADRGGLIMISLEPRGGSPTGLPTGPVVWSGALER